MWYVAFTLGLFGSLHCIGMCGPLAVAFCNGKSNNNFYHVVSALSYNIGRTITYALLGLIFGLFGSTLFLLDLQKVLSIVIGAIFVLSFFVSFDIDRSISKIRIISIFYDRLRTSISNLYSTSKRYPPLILGMANGLLPCGLVYLALAGALASGSYLEGMIFMAFFGLGTIPMMGTVIFGYKFLRPHWRMGLNKVLPYVTLVFGLFLIYRGLVVGLPSELNFWEALRNPVMCH